MVKHGAVGGSAIISCSLVLGDGCPMLPGQAPISGRHVGPDPGRETPAGLLATKCAGGGWGLSDRDGCGTVGAVLQQSRRG